MKHHKPIPSELQDRAARIYLESDHDARLAGEWREPDDADAGMRLAAIIVVAAAFVVGGVILFGVLQLLAQ